MVVDLYCAPGWSTSRAIELVAKAVGVEIKVIAIDTKNKEHLEPSFIKINPQHTLPTIVDNGFSLWETRAILGYLVNKYGKEDTLYPKDPQARALVDQRLYFDMGIMYERFLQYLIPIFMLSKPGDPTLLEKLQDGLKFLDTFLENLEWVAGPNITIADIALVTTVSAIDYLKIDLTRHPNVVRWLNKCKENIIGYEEINQKPMELSMKKIADLLNKE